MRTSPRLRSLYVDCSVILLNMFLAVIALNVVLGLYFATKDRTGEPTSPIDILRTRLRDRGWPLDRIYPGLDLQSVDQILEETWSNRRFVYQPFTQYTEHPYKGRFVNVTEAGFRRSRDQGPWPPSPDSYNVFLFGGSTTFSYGLPDIQTLGSYLQSELAADTRRHIRFYNFGRAGYQSPQERILFQEMLAGGLRPDLAIFVDGLNDALGFYDPRPAFASAIEGFFERINDHKWYTNLLEDTSNLPMRRLAVSVGRRLHLKAFSGPDREMPKMPLPGKFPAQLMSGIQAHRSSLDDAEAIQAGVRRYLANKREIDAVAKEFGVAAVFVWQPIPEYKYNKAYYLMGESDNPTSHFFRAGYARMRQVTETDSPGENFLWCADLQEFLAEPLYVDSLHYTAGMNGYLARYIAGLMLKRGLISAL